MVEVRRVRPGDPAVAISHAFRVSLVLDREVRQRRQGQRWVLEARPEADERLVQPSLKRQRSASGGGTSRERQRRRVRD